MSIGEHRSNEETSARAAPASAAPTIDTIEASIPRLGRLAAGTGALGAVLAQLTARVQGPEAGRRATSHLMTPVMLWSGLKHPALA